MTEKILIKRAPRIPLDAEVNCDGNKFVYSKNISSSGILLISDTEWPVDKIIQLSFLLPNTGKKVTAFGKVVRTNRISENFFEIGLSFWDISDTNKKMLNDFFATQNL